MAEPFFSLRFFFSILPPRYRIPKDFSFGFLPSISLLLNQAKEISLCDTLIRTVCIDLSRVHICFFANSPPKFSLVFFPFSIKIWIQVKIERERWNETSTFVGLLPEIPVVSQLSLSDYPFSLAIWTCLGN